MDLPCGTCNSDGFVSHGDRHVENLKEVCPDCKGLGTIKARTGEGPGSSASPDGSALYADKVARNAEFGRVAALDAPRPVDAITAHKITIGEEKPTRLTQLLRHNPEAEVYGDCCRTCFAMLLGYSKPEHVPHFAHDGPPDGVFWDRVNAWLGEMGYKIWQIVYPGDTPLQDIMLTQGMMNPGVYYLLAGKSPRGTQHVVVCLGDAVWADPHPDGGGIVGPDTDGFYRVEVLVPVRMTEFRRPRGHEDLPPTPGPV